MAPTGHTPLHKPQPVHSCTSAAIRHAASRWNTPAGQMTRHWPQEKQRFAYQAMQLPIRTNAFFGRW